MPYIPEDQRDKFDVLEDLEALNAGQLNYAITKLLLNYRNAHGESYSVYNDMIGALEGAKMELYRVQVSPYEARKRLENGDV